MTVLVVGEALVDVVHRGDHSDVHAGGSPFNVAVGLARLGVDVELAAQIGDDDHGRLLVAALDQAGVRRSTEVAASAETSRAVATLGDDGAASYDFAIDWAPGSLPDPSGFEAIHVGSLGTFLEPGASRVADLVLTADALGIPVSFDPNVRPTVSSDAAAWRAAFARFATHARVVKLSDEDAAVLHPDVAASDLALRLASEGALVAITQGAGGSVLAHRDRVVVVEAPVVPVADTIGAGDSFMAAALGWLATYDWPSPDELDLSELHDLGDYATRAAAITVSRPGADPPHLEEL